MPMWHTGSQPLAARGPPIEPGHLGGGCSLVDEHQLLRVEVGLALEPCLALRQDVGAILLAGMRGLFLSVIRRRAKKRHSVAMPAPIPCSANAARSSPKVTSGVFSTMPRISGECASILAER